MQLAAIRLFAAGKPRNVVAKALARHMYPDIHREDPSLALRKTRKRLRSWEETEWFRNAVYDGALMDLDMGLPEILQGMKRRARRRVDAARLVLEVTGRHNPRGQETQPTVVQINMGGAMPRPASRGELEEPIEDAEILEEGDE